MKTPWLILLFLLLPLLSCSSRPPAPPELSARDTSPRECGPIFPQGTWQFVHAIEFTLANGHRGNALGVSVIDGPVIECVLMTLEGFVLFAARFDGELEIKKALPPFDGPELARGLIADIQLIFTPPPSQGIEHGILANGDPLCRYLGPEGDLTDLILHGDGGWELDRYNAARQRTRTVTARPPLAPPAGEQKHTPSALELVSHEGQGYRLQMKLVRATQDLPPGI